MDIGKIARQYWTVRWLAVGLNGALAAYHCAQLAIMVYHLPATVSRTDALLLAWCATLATGGLVSTMMLAYFARNRT